MRQHFRNQFQSIRAARSMNSAPLVTMRSPAFSPSRTSSMSPARMPGVMRRVPQLAREKGHQQNAVFRAAQRDLRSFAVGQVQR